MSDVLSELRRCTELEYILLGDIRDLLTEPLTPQNRKWLLAILDALLDALPEEHRLKSEDGYLSEVLQEFPNWSSNVDRLEQEHYELYDQLADLRDDLEYGRPTRHLAAALRVSLREWSKAFVTHRRKEAQLLQNSVNMEIGGGD